MGINLYFLLMLVTVFFVSLFLFVLGISFIVMLFKSKKKIEDIETTLKGVFLGILSGITAGYVISIKDGLNILNIGTWSFWINFALGLSGLTFMVGLTTYILVETTHIGKSDIKKLKSYLNPLKFISENKKYFVTLLLLIITIFLLVWYRSINETLPSKLYKMNFEGDFIRDKAAEYRVDFEEDTVITFYDVKGKYINIELWGWSTIKDAYVKQHDSDNITKLNFGIESQENNMNKWKIDITELNFSKTVIILENEGIVPNGIFSFVSHQVQYPGYLTMDLYLGKYKTLNPGMSRNNENIELLHDPNSNSVGVRLRGDEIDTTSVIRYNLYTYDSNKKFLKETLFAFIIPFIFLTLQHLLKIIGWD